MKVIEGKIEGAGLKVAIVAARFNDFLVKSLIEGASGALRRYGVADDDITLIHVPGSYEIPAVAKAVATRGNVDGILGLGVVIRGATNHFDLVCGEASSGLARVAYETQVACAFGVVTAENIEQAIERCGTKAGNKGADTAAALLEIISVMKQVGS